MAAGFGAFPVPSATFGTIGASIVSFGLASSTGGCALSSGAVSVGGAVMSLVLAWATLVFVFDFPAELRRESGLVAAARGWVTGVGICGA